MIYDSKRMTNIVFLLYSLLVNRIRCKFSARNSFHLYRSPIFVCHGNVYCYCLISFHLLVCSIQNVHQKCWINVVLKRPKIINRNIDNEIIVNTNAHRILPYMYHLYNITNKWIQGRITKFSARPSVYYRRCVKQDEEMNA